MTKMMPALVRSSRAYERTAEQKSRIMMGLLNWSHRSDQADWRRGLRGTARASCSCAADSVSPCSDVPSEFSNRSVSIDQQGLSGGALSVITILPRQLCGAALGAQGNTRAS